MNKEEELQSYLFAIEQYKEQTTSLEMQFSYVQNAILDYSRAKITLENLNNEDKEVDVLFPIGGGTYVDAQAKKTSTVLFDIGAGIVIEKTSEDAIKKIQGRIGDLQKTQERIASMIQQIQSEASELTEKAQRLLNEAKK
ncbi:MAG: prefoldin subunit alpha [Candidatus Thermoplasmatota archaeon]|nr:prefoldin subunit alpha [Candidatus Thermoplasmatota archaeon]